MTRLLAVALISAALVGPSWAQAAPEAADAGEVDKVVRGTVDSVLEALKSTAKDPAARRQKVLAVMNPVANFELMGKLALGPAHWQKFSEPQRKEFLDTFARTLRNSAMEKLDIYTDETVSYEKPVPAEKRKYTQLVNVRSKGQNVGVVFKMHKLEAAWKVYDIEIEGVSIVRTYSAQYDQVLAKGSPQDLLDKMKAQTLATPEAIKNVGAAKKSER